MALTVEDAMTGSVVPATPTLGGPPSTLPTPGRGGPDKAVASGSRAAGASARQETKGRDLWVLRRSNRAAKIKGVHARCARISGPFFRRGHRAGHTGHSLGHVSLALHPVRSQEVAPREALTGTSGIKLSLPQFCRVRLISASAWPKKKQSIAPAATAPVAPAQAAVTAPAVMS